MKLSISADGSFAVLEEDNKYFLVSQDDADGLNFREVSCESLAAISRGWGRLHSIEIDSREQILAIINEESDKYGGLLCFSFTLDKGTSKKNRPEFAKEAEKLIQKEPVLKHITSVCFQKVEIPNLDIEGAIKICDKYNLPNLRDVYLKMEELYK
jgi:hypothetical protein